MNSLRKAIAHNSLQDKIYSKDNGSSVDRGYINLLPSVGSSVSSEDDFTNRALYSAIRRRLKSDSSDSSSTDEDLVFEEVHYGAILSRQARRRRLRGKFCSQKRYSTSISSTSSMSSPEKETPTSPAIYYDLYDNETINAIEEITPKVEIQENVDLNRGQLKLVICGSPEKVTVTVLELTIHLIPDDDLSAQTKFRTNSIRSNPESATVFHETFTFDLRTPDLSKRVLITAWARNTSGQRPCFLGCMSFGLHKIIENGEIIQGSYYLLSESLGRKKHLSAKIQDHKKHADNLNANGFVRHAAIRSTISTTNDSNLYRNININLSGNENPGFYLCKNSSEVFSVCKNSAAHNCGLLAGDVIVKVNQQLVRSIGHNEMISIIRSCRGTLQLLIRRTRPSQDFQQDARKRECRKRRSQQMSGEYAHVKRRRSCRINSNPSDDYKPNDTAEDDCYVDYEDDDVFYNKSDSKKWKKLHVSNAKKPVASSAVYYDLNTFVRPMEATSVQAKSAKIRTQRFDSNSTLSNVANVRARFPNNASNNRTSLTQSETDNISIQNNTKSSAVYYDIGPSLPALDELSVSSDSGISEDNGTLRKARECADSSSTLSVSHADKSTKKKENKLNFLSRVYSRDNRKTQEKKNVKPTLTQVLKSRKLTLMFRAYLQKEYSEENLDFWLVCEDYKQTKTKKLRKYAEKIVKQYLEIGANYEVNITAEIRSSVIRRLKEPTQNLFSEAQMHIERLMETDSFSRYLESLS